MASLIGVMAVDMAGYTMNGRRVDYDKGGWPKNSRALAL
jgi:hypothetical protein